MKADDACALPCVQHLRNQVAGFEPGVARRQAAIQSKRLGALKAPRQPLLCASGEDRQYRG